MFKDGDIICFLGDSITASGLWMSEVYQHLRKKYKIKCYNCGVGGSIADKARGYMYTECLIYNPDYVVLMFGMNDMSLPLYATDKEETAELMAERRNCADVHKRSYEEIICNCINSGAKVIICLPTPYDEVTESAVEKNSYQQALEEAAAFHLEMAEKYNLTVVNFKDVMLPMLGKRDIIKPDRVHPNPEGEHIMAQTFLKDVGEIDEVDFDTPFEFEQWNKDRYDSEAIVKLLNFVELSAIYYEGYAAGKSSDEIKEIAQKRYEEFENKNEFIPSTYFKYIEKGHLRTRLKAEIIKRTI